MSRSIARASLLTAGLFLSLPAIATAQGDIRTERVHFARGATSATVEETIQGYETVDYLLGAGAGQYMNVSLATDNSSNYFNILAPGETSVAMFVGSTSGNQYEGTLPAAGDYTVRVYLMRNAARRNETANYRLEMIITGSPNAALAGDALVPGTEYHATGLITCSMGGGQPTGSCEFGVKREGNGGGIVTVTKPDGRQRNIFFQNGTAISADVSQADPGEFSASKEADLSIVRIGEERYEIPDGVIYGG
jgi:hypothetical protein